MEISKENLYYQEQIALEGEIALFLSTAPHDAEMLYRIFMLLESSPKKLLPYLITEIKEQVEIKEEVLELIVLQAREHETPVWLWLDRCIADIKQCVEGNELFFNPHKLSVNKRKARIKIVTSAFCVFLRRLGLLCAPAANALITRILGEGELNFLHNLCFLFKDQLEELNKIRTPKKIIGRDILDMSFEPKEILNFNKMLAGREEEEPEKLENALLHLDEEEHHEDVEQRLNGIRTTLESIVDKLSKLPEGTVEVKEEINNKYIVMKKQADFNIMLKIFNTKEEAENYIKEIKSKAPDLKAEFEVKEVESRTVWRK